MGVYYGKTAFVTSLPLRRINQDFRAISSTQQNQVFTIWTRMTETHPEKRLIGYARVSTYGQTLEASLSSFAPPDAAAGIFAREGDRRAGRPARA